MIWHIIQSVKVRRKDLCVIWLDLANAYLSVPTPISSTDLSDPGKLQSYLMQYYETFVMRFTARNNTTRWQRFEVGIPMGCTISYSV